MGGPGRHPGQGQGRARGEGSGQQVEAKRRRVVEEEEELGEEDVAILLNTCEEGEDLEMAEEDITKLLDTSVTEAEMAVAAAMEKVMEGARVAAAILELLQM